ncbi:helix-turn-helix domain-containing protein [uncultured Dysosmobacter sp.]|uniref:helix-turn-helix domain-containing protein n=1 Tax=uncultured Dysosmobacter sp. TaxID=2591384 RepID=UPI00262FA27C|nr:helix-turn-helix transcriptional regulator [uncultured Dysosmobacter sp.]
MEFSEKLMNLRRREGLSQEQLADRLGVTRQSVSKWESGTAMPELVKLISLSELFGVSVDYLVKDRLEEPEFPSGVEEVSSHQADRLERKVDQLTLDYRRSFGNVFRYTSRARLFGLPLVSVCFGHDRHPTRNNTAVGIVAVGNFSVGVFSVGLISLGVVSLGIIAFGLLALGGVALGVGAVGLTALGYAALGISAVGVCAGGVAATGARVAVGVTAAAPVAVGREASGIHVLLWGSGLSREEVEAFLTVHDSGLWPPLMRLLSTLGAHIQ